MIGRVGEKNDTRAYNMPKTTEKKPALHEMPAVRHRLAKETDGSKHKREAMGEPEASELESVAREARYTDT